MICSSHLLRVCKFLMKGRKRREKEEEKKRNEKFTMFDDDALFIASVLVYVEENLGKKLMGDAMSELKGLAQVKWF